MLRIWLWTVGSVVLASAIPLAGLWLARLHPPAVERMLPALVSFAVGALLGGAMLHLLPEALAGRDDPRTVFGWFLLGFVGFLVLEMLLTRRRVGDGVIAALLPVAAGGFVYLAASELIPELRRRPGRSEALLQLMLLLTGLGLMAWTAAR